MSAREHFAQVRALPRRVRRRVHARPTLVRGLDYYTRTTFEFVGPDERRRARRSAAAAATTTSSRRSAARRPRASASAPGIERLILSLELESVTAGAAALEVFLVVDERARAPTSLTAMAELRAAGSRATPTTPAARSRASSRRRSARRAHVVVRTSDGWIASPARRAGLDVRRRARGAAVSSWRDTTCGAPRRGRRRQARQARRLGRHAPRPRRPRLRRPARLQRQGAARDQPGARRRRGDARARDPQRVRPPGGGGGRPRARRGGEPEHADGRDRGAGRHAAIVSRSEPLPFQIGEERRRGAAPQVPLARHAQRPHAAQPAPQPHRDPGDPPHDGRARVHRRVDAVDDEGHARGRARLPRAGPAAARAGSSRSRSRRSSSSSSAWSAGSTATTRSRRAGATRISAPTGSSSSGSSTSRCRSSTARTCSTCSSAASSRASRPLGREPPPTPFPRLALRRRDATLRHRQARPSLRPRDPGRDRADARVGVRRLRERAGRALPRRAAGVLARRARRGSRRSRRSGARRGSRTS